MSEKIFAGIDVLKCYLVASLTVNKKSKTDNQDAKSKKSGARGLYA